MSKELNGYELSKDWFDFCFENPELISPNHTAMYFFIIEHCNRLGWKEKFGLPMQMCMDAIGIKNYKTYSKAFNDLIDWGFIKLYEKSVNQYSANVIALVKNTKAHTKALSKAMQKHSQKQVHGIVGIDKPINQITIKPNNKEDFILNDFEISKTIEFVKTTAQKTFTAAEISEYWAAFLIQHENEFYLNKDKRVQHFRNWLKNQKNGKAIIKSITASSEDRNSKYAERL